jgi:alpha/beta superfamily hydrolase
MGEPHTLTTADGLALEAELFPADGEQPRAGMVICHPHPQFGGNMRSLVVSALVRALPAHGVTCLRFNFRAVEGSEGTWDEGRNERLDVSAAVDALHVALAPGTPLVLAGWSFGADMALSTIDSRIDGWYAIAPPLRWGRPDDVAMDPRPKLVALAEHDEVRPAAELVSITADWRSTRTVVVAGASHFFVGRTDRLVEVARDFVDRVAG